MPVIPTYTADIQTGVTQQPRATAQTAVYEGLAQVGTVAGQISTSARRKAEREALEAEKLQKSLDDINDKAAMGRASVTYAREVGKLNQIFANDYDLQDINDRYSRGMEEVKTLSLNGLSENARRIMEIKVDEAIAGDIIRFQIGTEKKRGIQARAGWVDDYPVFERLLVEAQTPEEQQSVFDSVDTYLDSVSPYYNPKDFSILRQSTKENLYSALALKDVQNREFEAENYAGKLQYQTILKFEAAQKSYKDDNIQRAKTYYKEFYDGWKKTIVETGDIGNLTAVMDAFGDTKTANRLREEEGIYLLQHDVMAEANALNNSGSLEELKEKALNSDLLKVSKNDRLASVKFDVANKLSTALDGLTSDVKARAKALYNDNIKDHLAQAEATGEITDLEAQLRAMGADALADEVSSATSLVVHEKEVGLRLLDEDVSIKEAYGEGLTAGSLVIDLEDKSAYEKLKVQKSIESSMEETINEYKADKAKFAAGKIPPFDESRETRRDYYLRNMAKQRSLEANVNAETFIFTKEERNQWSYELKAALSSQDGETILAQVNKFRELGELSGKALDELKLPSSLQFAMDAPDDKAVKLFSLYDDRIKSPTDIRKDYDANDAPEEVTESDIAQYYLRGAMRGLGINYFDAYNNFIETGHRLRASGENVDNFFDYVDICDESRALVTLPSGVSAGELNYMAGKFLNTFNFALVTNKNTADFDYKVKSRKESTFLIDADPFDDRIKKGQRGYYIKSPDQNGVLMTQGRGRRPYLVTAAQLAQHSAALGEDAFSR